MIENNVPKCRMCNKPTRCVVQINFRAIPICDECCRTITKQTVLEKIK